jgi:hypothetical protein
LLDLGLHRSHQLPDTIRRQYLVHRLIRRAYWRISIISSSESSAGSRTSCVTMNSVFCLILALSLLSMFCLVAPQFR